MAFPGIDPARLILALCCIAGSGCGAGSSVSGEGDAIFGPGIRGGYELPASWQQARVLARAGSAYVVQPPGPDSGLYPRAAAIGSLDVRVQTAPGLASGSARVSVTPHGGQHDLLVFGTDENDRVRVGQLSTGSYEVSLWRADLSHPATSSVVEVANQTVRVVTLVNE